MIIRDHRPEDFEALYALFRDTVRSINRRDYSEAQVAAWAPDSFEPERWAERIANYRIFVAEDGQGIAGFAELDRDGHIDCFFVHKDRQGEGVGGRLMRAVQNEAEERGLPRLYAEVSITARPFFERHGFVVLAEQQVELRGEKLTNFRMEKHL